jgi:hypothetical protein
VQLLYHTVALAERWYFSNLGSYESLRVRGGRPFAEGPSTSEHRTVSFAGQEAMKRGIG